MMVRVFGFVRRKPVRIVISIAVLSLALIYAGVRLRASWQSVQQLRWDIDYRWFPLAIVLYLFNLQIFLLMWHRMLTTFHPGLRLRDNAYRYALANLPKYLPTIFWYVAGRIHLYELVGVRRSITLAVTLLEVLLHAAAGVIIYTLLLAATAPDDWQRVAWASLTVVLVVLLAQPQHAMRLVGYLRRWLPLPAIPLSSFGGKTLLGWCSAYIVTWLIGLPFFYLIIRAFPEAGTPSLVALARIWCLVGLVDYLTSWTLGGLAFTRDITLTFLLSHVIPLPVAIAVAATLKLILLISDLLGNILFLVITRWFMRREPEIVIQRTPS